MVRFAARKEVLICKKPLFKQPKRAICQCPDIRLGMFELMGL